MAESMSIEAVLSAVDQNFTKTMEQAVQSLGEVIDKSHQTASAGTAGAGGVKQLASSLGLVAIGAKAFDVLTSSLDGAIQRFDTLNKFPVVMQALGYSARDTAKSTSILKKGVDGLPTTLQDVTSVAQQLAPLTGSASKASKSAIALNNAFLASGASGADASRGLEQYTQMLSTGKVDMMSWRTLMETMPIALRKVANSFGFTGKSAEQDLFKALQSGQITMDQLNDRFIKLNKGQNGFAALAKKNSAGIMTSFTNLKNAVANNMEGMLERINQGFSKAGLGSIAQQLDNLKYGINAAFKAIGPAVTAGTVVAINAFKGLFNAVGAVFSFVGKNKNWLAPLAVGIGTFAASIAGIMKTMTVASKIMAGLKIAGEIKTVGPVLLAMAKGSSAASSALTFMAQDSKLAAAALKVVNAVAAMNPWVILAAAIIAVVAALTFFFTQTKTGKAVWADFTSWLSGVWQGLVGIATTVWNAIGNAITAVVNFIKPIWQGMVSFFSGIWQSILAVALPIWMGIVDVVRSVVTLISTIFQGLAAILGPIIAVVVAVVGSAFIALVGTISTLWNMLVPVIQVVWQLITAVITTALSVITTIITTAISVIVTVWTTIWNVLVTVVSTVWSVIGTVVTAGLQVIADIFTAITDVLQGNWSGAWNEIKNIVSITLGSIGSVVSTVLSGIASIFSSVMNGLKGVASAGWNGIKGLFNAGVNFIKSIVHVDLTGAGRAIMQSLWNGMKAVWEGIKGFVSHIAGWIKDHKGPISLDRRLLIPAGNAIMQGLNAGLTDGFKTVQSTVTAMTNVIAESANVVDFADAVQALNSMSGMKLNADGTLSSTQTINNVTSRTFEARMTEMVATAINKLDNVDQHPIVTPVTMNQMHQYTNKIDAQSYVMWRGE